MSSASKLRTLILTLQYAHRASYYDDWVTAYASSELFDCEVLNLFKISPDDLSSRVNECDLIILLHSATGDTLEYLAPLQQTLAGRNGPTLLSFLGNEFNSPYIKLSDKVTLLKDCRVDIIATQLLEEAGSYAYQHSGAKVVSIPHALNQTAFNSNRSYDDRKIDVGMRSYRYPPYLGDNERNCIIDYFVENERHLGLVQDISTTKRFTPDKWSSFLGNCRSVLSTETGSWYLHPDDTLAEAVLDYAQHQRSGIMLNEDSKLRSLVRHLPAFVKSPLMYALKKGPVKYGAFEDEKLDFEEVYERVYKNASKSPVYTKAISSRNFDAIGTRTCQIMFTGRYNDILLADEHYIPLNKDFSNIDEAIRKLRDKDLWRKIVDNAYEMVLEAHTYEHRALTTYNAVVEHSATQ